MKRADRPEVERLAGWNRASRARITALDSQRAEGAWSAAAAANIALTYLATLDAQRLAARDSRITADNITLRGARTRFLAACADAFERVQPFVDVSAAAARDGFNRSVSLATQRELLAVVQRAAAAVRARAALVAPDVERALRASVSPWDAPEAFPGERTLEAIAAGIDGRATLTLRPIGDDPSGEAREVAEHWQRLAGALAVATPSVEARSFAGLAGLLQQRDDGEGDDGELLDTPRAIVEWLLDAAAKLRGHPLAGLAVFVEAAGLLPLGARAYTDGGDAGTVRVRRRVAMAQRALAESRAHHGPRDHVRTAAELLGWRMSDLDGAERAARSRANRAKRRKGARARK